MEFRILGPLEVLDGTTALPLGGGKQRALLADLLLSPNRVVSVERLLDDLWGEEVPESARKMVQIYVSHLRKALPQGRLRTRPPGYTIELGDGELDLERFEQLLSEGRETLARGEADRASGLLREALSLWRGPALAEFPEPFARAESARLEELRLSALEERIDADLGRGLHAELVGELGVLIPRHPLRERLRGQQMLALYRSGRQPEALDAYRAHRQTLDDDLGMEPSAALKDLERRMLRQDPELEPLPTQSVRSPVGQPPAGDLKAPPDPTRTQSPGGGSRPAAGGRRLFVPPETRYALSGDVAIAYQVVGSGPLDLVFVMGWVSNLDLFWEEPSFARFLRRLASFSRLILFDKRGTGLSDRVGVSELPTLEQRMDDVRAVMDAVGSKRAALMGVSEGGPMCLLFGATYPERTAALVVIGSYARRLRADDYPFGTSKEERAAFLEAVGRDWGGPVGLERRAPSMVDDERFRAWWTNYLRMSASPGAAHALSSMNAEIDVRHVLPAVTAPTLVVHRTNDRTLPVEGARYMAERIPGARLLELPGDDHLPFVGNQDEILDEVEEFLTGIRPSPEPDRILTTVLFTDIVGSSERAAAIGDRAWRDLLERHHAIVRHELMRFRGQEVDTTGDGFLATFDGPARAIRCACSIVEGVRGLGLELRAGLHTGECELVDGKVAGIAVHTGARIASQAGPGEVLVSQTVKDLVAGSGLEFEDRGLRSLSGVPGEWRLLAVNPASANPG